MKEKMIIQSKRYHIKTLMIITCILLVMEIVGLILIFKVNGELTDQATIHYATNVATILCSIGGLSIFVLPFFCAIAKMEINVTDKRVYGKAKFGKRIDLPLDSISAVGTGFLKGITVATSSGKIHFIAISNNKEIHEEISKLLIERQEIGKLATSTIKQEIPQSNADEIQKYKNLLDNGTISQEEFDAKKKQLLGL